MQGAWLHQTFNSKKVVDWLFRFGDLDAHDVSLVSDETAACTRRNSQAANGVHDSGKLERAEAAKKRRRRAWTQNHAKKQECLAITEGFCETCGWWGQRIRCLPCQSAVCRQWCQYLEHVLCQQCFRVHGTKLQEPLTIALVPNPGVCHTCGDSGNIVGPCARCNRWLCIQCSVDQLPPRCVQCPAIMGASGGCTGMSQKVPSQVRRPGSVFDTIVRAPLDRLWASADQATHRAGTGRYSSGQYTAATRAAGQGFVHRAGQGGRRHKHSNTA
jgi:hypothetical protein